MMNNQVEETKWIVSTGRIDKEFYMEHFQDEFSKQTQKQFNDIFNDEEYVEFERINVKNINDSPYEFTTLWFFDVNYKNGMFPCYKPNMNTSSCFAMECCNIDDNDYMTIDDDEDNSKTLDEILEYTKITGIKEIITGWLTGVNTQF